MPIFNQHNNRAFQHHHSVFFKANARKSISSQSISLKFSLLSPISIQAFALLSAFPQTRTTPLSLCLPTWSPCSRSRCHRLSPPPSLLLAALQTPQALSPQTWLLPKNTLRPNSRRRVSSDAIPTSFPKHRMKQPQEPQPRRRTSPSSLPIPIPQKEAVLFTSFIWTFKSEERTKQRAKQIIHSF